MRILVAVLLVLVTAAPVAADSHTSFLATDDAVPSRGHPAVAVTYTVQVRGDVAADLGEFRAVARRTLNDPQGWGAGGQVAFVPTTRNADFRLVLASPASVADADPECGRRYSCRVGDDVLINDVRWRTGTDSYRHRPLNDYRRYVLNHEVGHWLGLDHSECGGIGEPAWVMQQQSKGLDGCTVGIHPRPAEQREALVSLDVRR